MSKLSQVICFVKTDPYHAWPEYIGVAPITQVTHVRNKNSNTKCDKSEFLCYKKLLIKERILSLKASSHLKKDAIKEIIDPVVCL